MMSLMNSIHGKPIRMSWSSYSAFKYSSEGWYNKWILGNKEPPTVELDFGKKVATSIEDGTCQVPLLLAALAKKKEFPFECALGDIPLVGFADAYDEGTHKVIHEVKTGHKEWDQKRVDEHGQLTFYALMNFLMFKIPPEEVEIKLFWLPTQLNNDFTITFTVPIRIETFDTKRTMSDILRLGADIKKVWASMEYMFKVANILREGADIKKLSDAYGELLMDASKTVDNSIEPKA